MSNPHATTLAQSSRFRRQADKRWVRDLLLATLCFVFTFGICWWQNPSSIPPNTTLYFDSGHYLGTTERLWQAAREILAGKATLDTYRALAHYLMLDGPVLPAITAAMLALAGKIPATGNWSYLVLLQCGYHALTSLLLFMLTRRLSGNSAAACMAGILWGFYPSTLVSAASFLTEPLSCLLLLSTIYFQSGLVSTNRSLIQRAVLGFACGAGAAALALLKAALIPALCLTFLVVFWQLIAKGIWSGHAAPGDTEDWRETLARTTAVSRSRRAALVVLLAVAAGMCSVLAPWATFTKAATGRAVLIPSRLPVYNIATGLNLESDGWGCYPTHPLTAMFSESDHTAAVAIGLSSRQPVETASLVLRKLPRLLLSPWNDFKHKLIWLSPRAQLMMQSLYVALGGLGALFLLSMLPVTTGREKRFLVVALTLAALSHLVYLPFEGIARYGYTAMPIFIALACSLVCRFVCWSSKPALFAWLTLFSFLAVARLDLLPFLSIVCPSINICLAVETVIRLSILAVSLYLWYLTLSPTLRGAAGRLFLGTGLAAAFGLAAAVTLAYEYSPVESREWQCQIRPGETACRQVDMHVARQPDWVLLLVDADMSVSGATISINGHRLTGPMRSLYHFYPSRYELQSYFQMFASLLRKSPDQLRQWRVMEVPLEMLNLHGTNEIRVTPAGQQAVAINGEYLRTGLERSPYIPAFTEISPGKLFNSTESSPDCRMARPPGSCLAPGPCFRMEGNRRDDKDLSSKPGRQTGLYRLYLLAGFGHPTSDPQDGSTITNDTEIESGEPVVSSEDASRTKKPATLKSAAVVVRIPDQASSPASARQSSQSNTSMPDRENPEVEVVFGKGPVRLRVNIPKRCLSRTHVAVKLRGEIRARTEPSQIAAACVLETGDRQDLKATLPDTPRIIPATRTWQPLILDSEVPSTALAGSAPALTLELTSYPQTVTLRNLQLFLCPLTRPTLENHSLKFF